jgi:hypothetical protein
MFGILEFLGLATLAQGFDSAGPDEKESGKTESLGHDSLAANSTADPALAEGPSSPGSPAWTLLYGGEGPSAAATENASLLSRDDAPVPLIDEFDPAMERLVIGYDTEASSAPHVTIESAADANGNLIDIIRLNGAPVARVVSLPGAPALSLDSIALVPESELDDQGRTPA